MDRPPDSQARRHLELCKELLKTCLSTRHELERQLARLKAQLHHRRR